MDTLATRVSKEAYELSNLEWLHKEKKKTMEDWDEMKPINEGHGNRQITDPKARIKTTLCNEFNNETSFAYDHGGLQHEQRNYVRILTRYFVGLIRIAEMLWWRKFLQYVLRAHVIDV
jgi:hypothetical protein